MAQPELDQPAGSVPQGGELAHLTAEFLAAKGLRVIELNGFDPHGGSLLIHSPGARCKVCINDRAQVELLWQPQDPEAGDPMRVADFVARLLSADPVERDDGDNAAKDAVSNRIPFRGIVGRDLAARGFDAELRVHPDETFFDAIAYITVTRPEIDDPDGTEIVYVDDDHSFTWVANFRDDDLAVTEIARAIVDTVARAFSADYSGR